MSVERARVGYVLKVYPRLSETFILNEILAHEQAGLDLEIFSLRDPKESATHSDVTRVRAPVTYLPNESIDARTLGEALIRASNSLAPDDTILRFKKPPNPWVYYQAVRLADQAAERGISHLHAHFATEATTIARLAARMAGITYSFTAHAKDIFHESVDQDDLRRKARDAAAIVTVSDFNVQFLQDLLGEDADNVSRIYNGIDLDEFPCSTSQRDPTKIVAVGRLVEKKGFDVLVDACSLLVQQGHKFTCKVIGGGDLRESLKARAQGHGLEGFVEFTGPLAREVVRKEVCDASMLAAPCVVGDDGNRDGLPTVLLEAMALGTPCVSTPVTGIPEILHDGETGLLVAERSAEELAQAMLKLMHDRDLASQITRNARSLVEREFDIHRNTGELRRILCERSPVGAR